VEEQSVSFATVAVQEEREGLDVHKPSSCGDEATVLDILSSKLSHRGLPLAHTAPHLRAVGCLRDEQRVLGQKGGPLQDGGKTGQPALQGTLILCRRPPGTMVQVIAEGHKN